MAELLNPDRGDPAIGQSTSKYPMKPLTVEWLKKIRLSLKVKQKLFGQYADEAMKFYDGPHDWMWRQDYSSSEGGFLDKNSFGSGPMPGFRMTVNRPFEAVALFGPALIHKYPVATVTPSSYPTVSPESLDMDFSQQQSVLAYRGYLAQEQYEHESEKSVAAVTEHYLNWLQVEGNKKMHSRRSVTEAIVKGYGLLYTEIYHPHGSNISYPLSHHLSVDDLAKDPDAEYDENVQWIAIRHIEPVNLVEAKYGLKPGMLIGHMDSFEKQVKQRSKQRTASSPSDADKSFDLIEYWEVYSKNGFGDKLKSTNKRSVKAKTPFDYSIFGDFTRIVVARGIPFPLNMPPESLGEDPQSLFLRSQWPIPYWTDEGLGNGWPISDLFFYDKPKSVWPISMVKPAIGELRFVNWCMSFLADKVAASSMTYVGVMKAAAEDIQVQVKGGLAPYKVIEIADTLGRKIEDVISVINAPPFSMDIWRMVSEVMEQIDKRMGLTELLYGLTGSQIRSATEADIRDQNISIRPEDMAEKTEDWLSMSLMKEMQAAAWILEPKDLVPVLGPAGTAVWQSKIASRDFDSVVRDFKYRVAAGSARKPNRSMRIKSLREFGQVALPAMQAFAMQGFAGPWNAYMQDLGKAIDIDPNQYLLDGQAIQQAMAAQSEQEAKNRGTQGTTNRSGS